jgi:hypothetical protein
MTGRGVPQPSVGFFEASLPGLSPTASGVHPAREDSFLHLAGA